MADSTIPPPLFKTPESIAASLTLSNSNKSNAPALKTPNISDEPSDKWAQNALSAIADDSGGTTIPAPALGQSQSAVPTPGLKIPGSFPVTRADTAGVDEGMDIQYVKDTASSTFGSATEYAGVAAEKAKEYAGVAADKAKEYAGVAGDTVAPYLPETVAGYISTAHYEEVHQPPSFNGLDSVSGESVAKLPEEKRQQVLPSHDYESATPLGKSGGVGRLPGNLSESGVAVLPDEKTKMKGTMNQKIFNILNATLPSRDDESTTAAARLGKMGGAGPLPGSINAAGVAVLPDERESKTQYPMPIGPQKLNHTHDDHDHDDGASEGASTRRLAGSNLSVSKAEEGGGGPGIETLRDHTVTDSGHGGASGVIVESLREQNHSKPIPSLVDPTTTSHANNLKPVSSTPRNEGKGEDSMKAAVNREERAGAGGTGHDNVDDSSRAHPIQTTTNTTSHADAATMYPANTQHATKTHHPPGQGVGSSAAGLGGGMHRTDGGADDEESHGKDKEKHGFMSKLKGEAKVISGKIGRNEEKVEEGRKLMGKN